MGIVIDGAPKPEGPPETFEILTAPVAQGISGKYSEYQGKRVLNTVTYIDPQKSDARIQYTITYFDKDNNQIGTDSRYGNFSGGRCTAPVNQSMVDNGATTAAVTFVFSDNDKSVSRHPMVP